MLTLFLRLIWNSLGLILLAELVPGIEVNGFYIALISALVLGFLNTIVRPILLILTLPITILTLGLFTFIINAGLFMFVASFVDGFAVDGFWYALLGSVFMSVVSILGQRWIRPEPPQPKVEYREVREDSE